MLYHVTDAGPLRTMVPRPAPEHGRDLVWSIDEEHLPHYLLPRDCPRVCWKPVPDVPLLASPARRVIAVEHRWASRLAGAGLHVNRLDPVGFTLLDETAGYWVSPATVAVLDAYVVDDCFAALAARDVELRLTPTLWPYVDAVVAAACEFSGIRLRNALPARP